MKIVFNPTIALIISNKDAVKRIQIKKDKKMKASNQLFKIAQLINKQYFDPSLNYDWKQYRPKKKDIRHLYPNENNMLNKYKSDKVFQDAYKSGFLFFDKNGKLEKIHSKETFQSKLQPQKCNSDEVLVIGKFNDCYPISKQVFNDRYIHIKGSEYQKKTNIIVQAIENPYDRDILVKNQHGDLNCKVGDYITKNGNSYAVVDRKIFEETYQEIN